MSDDKVESFDDVLNVVGAYAPSLVPVFEYLRLALSGVQVDTITDTDEENIA